MTIHLLVFQAEMLWHKLYISYILQQIRQTAAKPVPWTFASAYCWETRRKNSF